MSADRVMSADSVYRVPSTDSTRLQESAAVTPPPHARGLWRTLLAGPGHTLAEAFANLEHSPQVERLVRHAKRDVVSARVTLTPEEGEGYWELTRIQNDIYVLVLNFLYKNTRFELVPGDGLIQFNFKLSGDMTFAPSRTEPLRFNRPSLLLWAQSPGCDINEWTAPCAHERQISISVRPEYLMENFLTSVVDLPDQLRGFISDPHGTIGYYQLPLTSEMFASATKLMKNPYKGKLALRYTEALVTEMICTAIDGFCSFPNAAGEGYSERTLKCLQRARSILMQQLAPAPTIRELAKTVGMAESALTRGFKAVYGETVSDFSVHCRMQQALRLLREQHLSIDKVSEAVGYSHPTSFATAFRHTFGMRPSEVRHVKAR